MTSPASPPRFHAVVVAAGRSTRLGGEVRKSWLELAGRPVLGHTLSAFAAAPGIATVVVVAPAEDHEAVGRLAAELGLPCLCTEGGATRADSVRAGLLALGEQADLVLVHDAARPLVLAEDIGRVAAAAARDGAALLASPVRDSLHRAEGERVVAPVPREDLWAAETPQAAGRAALLEAMEACRARGDSPTDEVTALRAAGSSVTLVRSTEPNPKLTWSGDVPLLESLLLARQTS